MIQKRRDQVYGWITCILSAVFEINEVSSYSHRLEEESLLRAPASAEMLCEIRSADDGQNDAIGRLKDDTGKDSCMSIARREYHKISK